MKIIKRKITNTETRHSKITPNNRLLRRILITNAFSILIVIGMYFWMVFFISNLGSFWDLFRQKEIYTTIDTVAPAPPYLSEIPSATQNDFIDLSGKAEAGIKVILNIDGSKESETISDSEGSFSFTGIKVGVFPSTIYITAIDDSNNESKKSQVYTIVKDDAPPELEVITPKSGEEVKSTGHTYKVTGKSEPETTVTVNGQLAIINQEGEFSVSIRLEEGDNTLTVKTKDVAGNETEQKVYVRFKKID